VNTWKSLLFYSSELLLSLIKLIYNLGFHTSEVCKKTDNQFLTELIKLTSLPHRLPVLQCLCSCSHIYGTYFYKRSHALPCSILAQTVFRSNHPTPIRIFLLAVLNITDYNHQHHHHCYFYCSNCYCYYYYILIFSVILTSSNFVF